MASYQHSRLVAGRLALRFVTTIFLISGGHPTLAFDDSSPFAYDSSIAEPVLPIYRELSRTAPSGYDAATLSNSLTNAADTDLAFLTYGDTHSRSVAVAVTRIQPRRLFVDLNRNRAFEPGEEIPSAAGTAADPWQLDLDAEFVIGSNQFEHVRRRVAIRVNPTTNALEMATLGCLRGTTSIDNRSVAVLRVDCNANGLWFDTEDRVWIDVNGDTRFAPLQEKFGCRTTCTLAGTPYAVAADDRGATFRLERIEGTGTLVPVCACDDEQGRVTGCQATLVSNTGVHVFLRDASSAVEVPVGTYRLHAVQVTLSDARGHWRMVFAHDTATKSPTWEVRKGEKIEIPLIGELTLGANKSLRQPNGERILVITPHVTTSTGLYVTICLMGQSAASDPNCAQIRSTIGTQVVDVGSSGFT